MCSTKTCIKCGIEKEIELFRKHRRVCKLCTTITAKIYKQENKDRISAYYKKYIQQNRRENRSEYNKKYYKENKEKRLGLRKIYRQENRDRLMYVSKKHYQENTEHYALYNFLKARGIEKDNISIELSDTILTVLKAKRQLRNHVQ